MDIHGYTDDGQISATIDGITMMVPNDPDNRHRQMIAAWEADGNTIPAYAPPPPSVEDFQRAIEQHVDAVAQGRQYSSAVSIATYLGSNVATWTAEAAAFIAWRDAVWLYALGELQRVQTGERPVPTLEAFLAELPGIEWPD
jgi:hypothetical protein